MELAFVKYQAAGNDFVLVDDRAAVWTAARLTETRAVWARLCHRQWGVGADGVVLLQPAADVAFRMLYLNADGAPGSFCGNGSRAALHFAAAQGWTPAGDTVRFLAADGLHRGRLLAEGRAESSLRLPEADPQQLPALGWFLDTGSPHLVVPLAADVSLEAYPLTSEGPRLRYHPQFAPGGTNVNVLQRDAAGRLLLRTWERGVEAETLSCGTGTVAAARVAQLLYPALGDALTLHTRGGPLEVRFEAAAGGGRQAWLAGPVAPVYRGQLSFPAAGRPADFFPAS